MSYGGSCPSFFGFQILASSCLLHTDWEPLDLLLDAEKC